MGMSGQDTGKEGQGAAHLHRLVLFSDAVFAIAITLLAIEIHPPEHWHGVADLLGQMQAKLIAYAVSFAVIGICWISHRRVYARFVRADMGLDILNFMVLGLVALLPVGTELLSEGRGGQALPVYVGLVAAIGGVMGVLWAYAAFIGKLTVPMSIGEAIFVLLRVALLPGIMCVLTFLSMAKPAFVLLFIPLGGALRFLAARMRTTADTPHPEAA